MTALKINKAKGTKKYVIKRKQNNKLILKAQQRFKSEKHNAFNEEINTISLSSNDYKRMQSIVSIETLYME